MKPTSYKISELCEIVRGVSFSKSEAKSTFFDGSLPIIRAGSIQRNLELDKDLLWIHGDKIKEKQKIKKNDILMCMSSGSSHLVGKTAISHSDWNGGFGAFCALLRVINNHCLPKYLYYILNSDNFLNWSTCSAGSNIKNIRVSELNDFTIKLPSIDDQMTIVNLMDKVSCIRQKREDAIKVANDFLYSVFLDMFGDPIINPKGFGIRLLKDFFIDEKNGTKCGPFGSALKKDEYTKVGVPVWSMDNITLKGDFIDSPSLWISEDKYRELNSYSVLDGDVIISRAGTVGKMGVVRSNSPKSIISTNLIRVRFSEKLYPEYFVSLMTYCKGRVGNLKTGPDGAFTHMNTGVLSNLEFPYPPLELQRKYNQIRQNVMSLIDKYNNYGHRIDETFYAINQKAFLGKP